MKYRKTPNGDVIHCDVCESNPSQHEVELRIGTTEEVFEVCNRCRTDAAALEDFRKSEEARLSYIEEGATALRVETRDRMTSEEERRRRLKRKQEHKAKLAKKHSRSTTND